MQSFENNLISSSSILPFAAQNKQSIVKFEKVPSHFMYGKPITAYFTPLSYTLPSGYLNSESTYYNDWIAIYPYTGSFSINQENFGPKRILAKLPVTSLGQVEFSAAHVAQRFAELKSTFSEYNAFQFVYIRTFPSSEKFVIYGYSAPFLFSTGDAITAGEFGEPTYYYPKTIGGASEFGEPSYYYPKTIGGASEFAYPVGGYTPAADWLQLSYGGDKKKWLAEVAYLFKEQLSAERVHRRFDYLHMHAILKSYERHVLGVLQQQLAIKEFLIGKRMQTYTARPLQPQPFGVFIGGGYTTDLYGAQYNNANLSLNAQIDAQLSVYEAIRAHIEACEHKLRTLIKTTADGGFMYAKYIDMIESKLGGGVKNAFNHEWIKATLGQIWQEMYEERQTSLLPEHIQVVSALEEIHQKLEYVSAQLSEVVFEQFNVPSFIAYQLQAPYGGAPVKQAEQAVYAIKHKLISGGGVGTGAAAAAGVVVPVGFMREMYADVKTLAAAFERYKATFYAQQPTLITWYAKREATLAKLAAFLASSVGDEYTRVKLDESGGLLREAYILLTELQHELFSILSVFQSSVLSTAAATDGTAYVIAAAAQRLQPILKAKLMHLSGLYERVPFEYALGSGQMLAWRELIKAEKRWIDAKSAAVARLQHKQLYARLVELEQRVTLLPKLRTSFGLEQKLKQFRELFALIEEEGYETEFYSFHKYAALYKPAQFESYHDMYYQAYDFFKQLDVLVSKAHFSGLIDGGEGLATYLERFLDSVPASYFKTVLGTYKKSMMIGRGGFYPTPIESGMSKYYKYAGDWNKKYASLPAYEMLTAGANKTYEFADIDGEFKKPFGGEGEYGYASSLIPCGTCEIVKKFSEFDSHFEAQF